MRDTGRFAGLPPSWERFVTDPARFAFGFQKYALGIGENLLYEEPELVPKVQ